ncbi:TonB-dependent receptor [Sulfurimonas sp. HSL-3221]|uniref:TonB-dependent receptor plug domain-containing protein n=1 Tax=Thiomicrolovo sulfuroxydans TaxID=2894755 RepID=UPI001E315D9F|nr:TonB-dependent receptor [Sulfurimonas sp. HSL-3221]UFS62585.1 TonB-dependent receptor [Sulfurimonas sp. HSL-3221]
MKQNPRLSTLLAALLAPALLCAESFELGQVSVTADPLLSEIFNDRVDAEQIDIYGDTTVSEALTRMTGVAFYSRGGRAETDISIRGFDSRRIGVFYDGVPIYVPYDGNMDYTRYLTTNIADIDVYKGFSSTAFGANTMGGVVNIVSKKPSRPFEGTVFAQGSIDSSGDQTGTMVGGNIGIREPHYYLQLSATGKHRDHSRLPESYDATPVQPEGDRLNSASDDRQVSAKYGYLLDGGEVALGYMYQHATKQQPTVTDPVYGREKYWDWPKWDMQSLYAVGKHTLFGGLFKATAYYTEYESKLYSYDDINLTTMNKKFAWKSNYKESTYGLRAEFTVDAAGNRLTLSSNYKHDHHKGYDIDKVTNASTLGEEFEDTTLSFGVEDSYRFAERFTLVAGIGYDVKSSDYISDPTIDDKKDESAWNPEAAFIAELAPKQTLRLSVAQKTYFPSMKERYSYKLGYGVPNGDLKPEMTTHSELAYKGVFNDAWIAEAAGFYLVTEDYIQAVYYDTLDGVNRTQNQNIGTFYRSGAELALSYIADVYEAGANATFLKIGSASSDKPIGVPTREYNLFTRVFFAPNLSGLVTLHGQSGAYGQLADSSYEKLGDVQTIDAKVTYLPITSVAVEVGVKNMADKLNYYDDGYPEPGREFYGRLTYSF